LCTSLLLATEVAEVYLILTLFRKRKGGIKLSDEETEAGEQEDLNSSTLSDELTAESPKESASDEQQKQKADALWADFLKDVGSVPNKSQPDSVVSINVFCYSGT